MSSAQLGQDIPTHATLKINASMSDEGEGVAAVHHCLGPALTTLTLPAVRFLSLRSRQTLTVFPLTCDSSYVMILDFFPALASAHSGAKLYAALLQR